MELEKIRKEIDRIDFELNKLFLRRMELGKEAMLEKVRLGKQIADGERERKILEDVSNESGEMSAYSSLLFKELISLSKSYQTAYNLLDAHYKCLLSPEIYEILNEFNNGTDAFIYTVSLAGISFSGKKVLVLGEGKTSQNVRTASEKLGANSIKAMSITGKTNYDNLKTYADTDIIVNTTPIGMYPDNLNSPINLDAFPKCSGVIDLIYNPHRTALLMDAEKRGIQNIGGLPMLVYQAGCAEGKARRVTVSESTLLETIGRLRAESGNIIIIGMPGSGKSSVAEAISRKTGRIFVNIDTEIVKTAGKSIPEIFEQDGEAAFRDIERAETAKAGSLMGAVIATGGGVVKDIRNYAPLHQNGRIYYLRRELTELEMEGRPLSKNFETLIQLQKEREPLYCYFADADIQNDVTLEEAAERIMEEYNENIGD